MFTMKSLEDFIAHFNIKSDLPALEKAVNVKTKKSVLGETVNTHTEKTWSFMLLLRQICLGWH